MNNERDILIEGGAVYAITKVIRLNIEAHEECGCEACIGTAREYEQALTKAKEQKVAFRPEDRNFLINIRRIQNLSYKDGDTFPCPSGFRVEIGWQKRKLTIEGGGWEDCNEPTHYYIDDCYRQFAKLSPIPAPASAQGTEPTLKTTYSPELIDHLKDVNKLRVEEMKKEATEGGEEKTAVKVERILNAVHKALQWEDGEIAGIDMNQLEQRIKGILK